MIPKSALEKALQATCLFPLYINRAALLSDPVERVNFQKILNLKIFFIFYKLSLNLLSAPL